MGGLSAPKIIGNMCFSVVETHRLRNADIEGAAFYESPMERSWFLFSATAHYNNLPNLKYALESWKIFKVCTFHGRIWVLESWS